jgi:hypothetical protein
VHDHAGGLVDDDEVVVFVEDRERERLGERRRGPWRRDVDVDRESGRDRQPRPDLAAPYPDVPVSDQLLDPGPRDIGQSCGEELIQAPACVLVRRDERK